MTKQQRRQAADELYDQAMDSTSFARAMNLLEKAIEIDPGHINSWIVLAEEEPDLNEAKRMLQEAIRHGRKELRNDLANHRGMFWGLWNTRPFMRAKHLLAETCRDLGELDEAATIMEEMLELNDSDNQGIRWVLPEIYLRQDRLADVEALLKKFPDDIIPFMTFTALLVRFRKNGDSPELRKDLQAQAARNPYIIPRLLDPQLISPTEHPMFSPGSEEEADLYCQQYLFAWKSAPGAISWLRSVAAKANLDVAPVIDDHEGEFDLKKEIQRLRKRVKILPSIDETWLADAVNQGGHDGSSQFWMLTVMEAEEQEPIMLEPGEGDRVTPDALFLGLLNAMLSPEMGDPRKPQRIVVFDNALFEKLRKRLERLEIELEFSDDRPEVFEFMDASTAAISGSIEINLESIALLPTLATSWIIDWKLLPILVPGEDGLPANPFTLLVVDEVSGLILTQQLLMHEPQEDDLALVVQQAAHHPRLPEPARPEKIVVRSADNRESVVFLSRAINVPVKVGDCRMADEAVKGLTEYLNAENSQIPSMLDICEGNISLVEDCYEAASAFYETRVWLKTPPETIVKVSCPDVLPGEWFATVMGQAGQELGVLFFDSLESILRLNAEANPEHPGKAVQHINGLSFSLNEQYSIHPDDVAAAEQFGWPVASAEAWPTMFYIGNGGLAPTTADHLRFLPIGVKAVTDRLQDKVADGTVVVQSLGESVDVTVTKIC